MARKTENEELVMQTDGQAEQDPVDMMAQLRQMQAELQEKMAQLDEREAKLAAKEAEKPAEAAEAAEDPFKDLRTIFLPRAAAGEQKFAYVSINGRGWKIPRGKHVDNVPFPVYERLMLMLERDAAAQSYRDSVPVNGEIGGKAVRA